jgi:hypothetical protein
LNTMEKTFFFFPLVLRFKFYETVSTIQTWRCPKSVATCPISSYTPPPPPKINSGSAPASHCYHASYNEHAAREALIDIKSV